MSNTTLHLATTRDGDPLPGGPLLAAYGVVAALVTVGMDLVASGITAPPPPELQIVKVLLLLYATAVFWQTVADRHAAAVRTAENRLTAAIDALAEPVILVDRNRRALPNRAAATLLRPSHATSTVGGFADVVCTADGIPTRGDAIASALTGDSIPRCDLALRVGDGTVVRVVASLTPIRAGRDVTHSVIVIRESTAVHGSYAAHDLRAGLATLPHERAVLREDRLSSTRRPAPVGVLALGRRS